MPKIILHEYRVPIAVNTMIATKEIPKHFNMFPHLKMSLHVTMYKAYDGGLLGG
jgi:hypothetical protein